MPQQDFTVQLIAAPNTPNSGAGTLTITPGATTNGVTAVTVSLQVTSGNVQSVANAQGSMQTCGAQTTVTVAWTPSAPMSLQASLISMSAGGKSLNGIAGGLVVADPAHPLKSFAGCAFGGTVS